MSCPTFPPVHWPDSSLRYRLSGGGVDGVETAREIGPGIVVALPGVVERALGIQKFNQAGFSAPIGVLHRAADVASLIEQRIFNSFEQPLGGFVLYPGVAHVVADIVLRGADAGQHLLLLLTRALDFALVLVVDRQRRLEEKSKYAGRAVVERVMELRANGVIHLALRDLAFQLGQAARVIFAQRL